MYTGKSNTKTTSTIGPVLPINPIEYPINFSHINETSGNTLEPTVHIFNCLQWLLPVFQLAGWLPKQLEQDERRKTNNKSNNNNNNNNENNENENNENDQVMKEVETTKRLLPHFEQFFTRESKVIPSGVLLYFIQTFQFPTPRGPRSLTRSFIETPNKYFSPLQQEKGGGHFLVCYEDTKLLKCFNYIELDQLRFAWVAVKELLEEHKAVQRTDGTLTGLARRDIKNNNNNNNSNSNTTANSSAISEAVKSSYSNNNNNNNNNNINNNIPPPPVIIRRQLPGSNVITGPTADTRKLREETQSKKYMSDLLKEECTLRWPHTPIHKSVIFKIEEQQAEVIGGRKGKKGPKTYFASVELPLFNKSKNNNNNNNNGMAVFRATQWCTNRRDAENNAAEVALRALRGYKS